MNTINDLFCTPEQGRRLQELVPELTSVFYWREHKHLLTRVVQHGDMETHHVKGKTYTPALTLQELRDVARRYCTPFHTDMFYSFLFAMTAPELAAWVIERLGGNEKNPKPSE